MESAASSASGLGPHGGPFVLLESGIVEISVFETGVPPVFRLYFFGRDKKAMPPMLPDKVRIETIRVGDKRQTFTFRYSSAYLESTTDIPEPHEFTACVVVSHDGHEHRYETEFTEEGHSHGGHDHGAHGHGDHGHAHSTGVLGWLWQLRSFAQRRG
jgi:nickel/cobalt transporter (NicO) family protein